MLKLTKFFADVFKKQMEPTLHILSHLQDQLVLMQELWKKSDRVGSLHSNDSMVFTPFRPLRELYQAVGLEDLERRHEEVFFSTIHAFC